jgi:Spy/CpxP family protein refolding chaperone
MTKNCIFIILFVLVFAVFSGCGRKPSERAFPEPRFRPPHREGIKDHSKFEHSMIDRMSKDLRLSEEQIEELKKLETEITEKRIEMMREKKHRENVKVKIVEMVKEDSLSKEEILSFMNELHSLGEECRKEADSFIAERLAKMHSILTKEQREKLAKKIEEFEPGRKFKPKKDIK